MSKPDGLWRRRRASEDLLKGTASILGLPTNACKLSNVIDLGKVGLRASAARFSPCAKASFCRLGI
jgi:hypothetical protein